MGEVSLSHCHPTDMEGVVIISQNNRVIPLNSQASFVLQCQVNMGELLV